MKLNSSLKHLAILVLGLCICTSSCKKFVTVDPPRNQISGEKAFDNEASAFAVLTGIYSEMIRSNAQFSSGYTTLFTGMAADELYYYSSNNNDEFTANQISQANHGLLALSFWQPAYKYIYTANLILEKIRSSPALSQTVKNALEGEAKFLRAFCYFQLVNLFGDVPLVTSTDYRVNSNIPRTASNVIYQKIVEDLTDASGLLSTLYISTERARPNKWACKALLARVHLYSKDWLKAESNATDVIQSMQYSLLPNLNSVFLKNSNEAIWQLSPSNSSWNTWEGSLILPASSTSSPTYLITSNLLQSFEAGDLRRTVWVNSRIFGGVTLYFPQKYKVYGNGAPITEYYIVLRLAEQFLIRAEARAMMNNITGAQADLNIIRNRASLANTSANTQNSLLSSIAQERRVELFAEWGHRWYDLKRTNQADVVLGNLKPSTWQTTDKLWPIPVSELNANPQLTQNPGY